MQYKKLIGNLFVFMALAFLVAGCKTGAAPATGTHILPEAKSEGVAMAFEGMQATVFGTPAAAPGETKVMVVTHGDSGGGDYMKGFAKALAGDGVVSLVLARSGCSIEGRRSVGYHSYKKGDHYTQGNIAAFNTALLAIKEYYKAGKIFMIGHSGGAATGGLVLGKYPQTLDGAILVSLPSDVKKWRAHRDRQKGRFGGSGWPNSQSPVDYVSNINPEAQIVVVVGEQDSNTTPYFAKLYVEAASAAGRTVKLDVVPGTGHNLSASGSDAKADVIYTEARAMLQ